MRNINIYPNNADSSKTVTILGSTGTIGRNTIKFIQHHPEKFLVDAITANENVELLIEQAKLLRPKLAVINNEQHYEQLKTALQGSGIKSAAGKQAVTDAAKTNSDITMSAIVGASCLEPTLAAIKNGKTIALANKESLICAGELMNNEAKKHNTKIIPVDSEHNAIFQLLPERADLNESLKYVRKITLTASGGPFRKFSLKEMENITPKQAIKHPNWNMGAKISVDSATMMNKGLELIEAFYLFPVKPEQLDILVHPQSIIHALIELTDNSVLAQMSTPDMCVPIANALAWPQRMESTASRLNLAEIGKLDFEPPDSDRFPALRIAREVLKKGGSAPTILNAANEIAVTNFLKERIKFLDISRIVEKTLEHVYNSPPTSIEEVMECDRIARSYSNKLIDNQ
ncbi:MAG: 1-deoxy-D-xylulose-5-phosphate reductoisomerase [Rickettsiales bacterium]